MKSKMLKILSYVVVALLSCALTLTVIFFLPLDNYTKLEQLEDLIADRFIGEVDRNQIQNAAADAMVSALGDRWSYYMTAEEYAAYKERMANVYVGVGVTVQLRQDGKGLDVTQVADGSSAKEAGILVGDVVTAVDGKSLEGMTLSEAGDLVRGKAGTKVTLTVVRGEEERNITLERRQIQKAVAIGTMLEGKIGLVQIVNFDSRCASETIAVIETLVDQGAEKLIFDVRNNPGGYKSELVKTLDYLLPEGLLFRSEYYDGTRLDDNSDEKCLDMPMAVLVNGDSYSAAEFFAAALRDYDWATVVGNQTCGKGYFQNTFELLDGSAIGLSVGKYYTPGGVSLAEVGGLTPDRIVEVDEKTDAAIYAGTLDPMEDPQILAAIEELNAEK